MVLLVLNAFIMMGLYYILKPVREGLDLPGNLYQSDREYISELKHRSGRASRSSFACKI